MSNEVVTSETLPFKIPEVSEEAKTQLAGIDLEYPVLKIPSAGGLFFEVDEEAVKEITGVVVYHAPRSMYYATEFDGSNNPPDCYSKDRITGYKTVEDNGGSTVQEMKCSECPYSQFGSDTKHLGKACKEKHQLYILCSDKLVPFSMLLPVSSASVLNVYATKIFSQGKFLNQVLTSFTLEKATNKSGIAYSKIVMKKLRDLTPDEIAVCAKYATTLETV